MKKPLWKIALKQSDRPDSDIPIFYKKNVWFMQWITTNYNQKHSQLNFGVDRRWIFESKVRNYFICRY